jgi:hypothetical protein
MKERGIVIERGDAKRIGSQAKLPATVQSTHDLPWKRTLFLDPELGRVPWEQVPRGFDFLDTWEVAAPIWNYETLASDVAVGDDRKATEALIGDLRVPLYVHELLFVRDCKGGRALLAAWAEEQASGGDVRLAFLRALYRTKPLFLALPRSWLKATNYSVRRQAGRRGRRTKAPGLIRVEISPGRFVQCRPEDEAKVREQFSQGRRGRRG